MLLFHNTTSSFQAKRLITNEFAAIKVIKLEPGVCAYVCIYLVVAVYVQDMD